MLEKRSFYEESARVPLLISAPWLQREQKEITGNIGHVDLVPTLLDLLGQALPKHLQGESRLPVLKDEAGLAANDVFIEWNGTSPQRLDRLLATSKINRMNALFWRSIVSGRWKLNLCTGDQCELFDLNSDPFEKVNLFDCDDQKDRIREMTARIRGWQIATGDDLVLPAV